MGLLEKCGCSVIFCRDSPVWSLAPIGARAFWVLGGIVGSGGIGVRWTFAWSELMIGWLFFEFFVRDYLGLDLGSLLGLCILRFFLMTQGLGGCWQREGIFFVVFCGKVLVY